MIVLVKSSVVFSSLINVINNDIKFKTKAMSLNHLNGYYVSCVRCGKTNY